MFGGDSGGGEGAGTAITWRVAANFKAVTVGGTTDYDLSS
jgi:hypothetical protein